MPFEGQKFETRKEGEVKELTPELKEQIIEEAQKILQEYVEEERKKVREEFEGKVPEEELNFRMYYHIETNLERWEFAEAMLKAIEKLGVEGDLVSLEQREAILEEVRERHREARDRRVKGDEKRESKEPSQEEPETTEETEEIEKA